MKILILTKFEYLDWMSSVAHGYDIHYITDLDYEIPDNYDVGISFMWTKKIPAGHVNSHPWFNFHPAPLPEYKGRNLCYHAIMNGEKEFGATLHYMDEGFDTGDIVNTVRFFIQDNWTSEDLSRQSIFFSKKLFENYFPRIVAGEELERHPNVGGTYYKKEAIMDTVTLTEDEPFGHFVRAVTYGDFCPKIDIGGIKYKIVRDK